MVYVDEKRVASILSRHNLLLVAPTGTGKTRGVVLGGKLLLENKTFDRIVITEPTRAAVGEVVRKVTKYIGPEFVGRDDSDARLLPKWNPSREWSKPFVATTYERLDSILITNGDKIVDRTLFIMDEAHQLTDPNRSTTLMNILAYLKMYNARVALLSATMPEIEGLANYLSAEVYSITGRPVKITVDRVEIPSSIEIIGSANYYETKLNRLLRWINENKIDIKELTPIYVYVPSRRWSERIAQRLKDNFPSLNIRFHHAGMPYQERKEIESEIVKKNPSIDIVVGTDTLSQSVNTAFKTVILLGLTRFKPHSIEVQKPEIMKQAMGRAGRPKYHNEGRVIVVYTYWERNNVERAISGAYNSVEEPSDYLALVLRLIYTGRDPSVWSKYAYKVSGEKINKAIDIGAKIGLIHIENGYNLSRLGKIVAKEYLPSESIPPLLLIDEGPIGEMLVAPEKYGVEKWQVVYYTAFLISYFSSRGWRIVGDIENKVLGMYGNPIYESMVNISDKMVHILGIEKPDVTNRIFDKMKLLAEISNGINEMLENESIGTGNFILSPTVLSVFAAKNVGYVDSLAESVRKGGQVLETYMRARLLLDRSFTINDISHARGLSTLMKAYRLSLKKVPAYSNALFMEGIPEIGVIGSKRINHEELLSLFIASIIQSKPLKEILGTVKSRDYFGKEVGKEKITNKETYMISEEELVDA